MRQQSSQKHPQKTSQQALARYALLDDLRRFGVTSSLAHKPSGILQEFIQPTAEKLRSTNNAHKTTETSPAPASVTPPNSKKHPAAQAKPRRSNFSPEQFVHHKQGQRPFTVVLTMEEGTLTPLSFTDPDEKELWRNMMAAIGEVADEGEEVPDYIMITGDAAVDGNLSDPDESQLQTLLQKKLAETAQAHKAILAVGGRARRLLLSMEDSSTDKTAGNTHLTLKKGCKCPLLTIYQLQAMLRQPALKRQTWATLLQLKETIA